MHAAVKFVSAVDEKIYYLMISDTGLDLWNSTDEVNIWSK